MERYLTSEQVADLLQVHQFTVLKYLKSGRLPGIKIGRMYRIKESDVEKFLENVSIATPAQNNQTQITEEPEEVEEVHEIKSEEKKEDQEGSYYEM